MTMVVPRIHCSKPFWRKALFLLCIVLVLYSSTTGTSVMAEEQEFDDNALARQAAPPAEGASMKDHLVHILHCVGWGYKRNFLEVQQFLEGQFPELKGKITGGKYPVPPILELVENLISALQLFAMAWIVFGGVNLFRFMGFRQTPAFVATVQEFGVQIAIAIFFLIPQLINNFAISGSFEIVLDGEHVVWSKLQQGRFPTAQELTNTLTGLGLVHAASS